VKKDFNFKMWIQRFKELSRDLQRQKVCAINCSPISKLDCFQRGSLK
jgi:ABC-type transporter Mla MlaB component